MSIRRSGRVSVIQILSAYLVPWPVALASAVLSERVGWRGNHCRPAQWSCCWRSQWHTKSCQSSTSGNTLVGARMPGYLLARRCFY